MTPKTEHETFVISRATIAKAIDSEETIVLSPGQLVTVVLVYGAVDAPEAYEIEAFVEERDLYALATVAAEDLV